MSCPVDSGEVPGWRRQAYKVRCRGITGMQDHFLLGGVFMRSKLLSFAFVALAAALIAGCGGGKSSSSGTTSTAASAPASPATVVGSPEASAGAMAPQAGARPQVPVPVTLHCGGQPPVWTNPRSHAYHLSTDPLYGRTKRGTYMCMRDAVSAGYHAAGAMRHHGKSSANGAMAQPSPSPAAT